MLFLAILIFIMFGSIGGGTCDNSIIEQQISPSGEYEAVIFSRDCGATTAASFHLSILEKDETIENNDKGNIFISHYKPEVNWGNEKTLNVDFVIDPFKQKKKFDEIDIIYKEY